jgi:hypothetical protein
MESRRIQISHKKSQLGKSLHCSVSSNPPRNILSALIAFLAGLVALVVRDLLHWRINALTSSLPQLAQGKRWQLDLDTFAYPNLISLVANGFSNQAT